MAPLGLLGTNHQRGRAGASRLSSAVANPSCSTPRLKEFTPTMIDNPEQVAGLLPPVWLRLYASSHQGSRFQRSVR
jgi:hypothetical protein